MLNLGQLVHEHAKHAPERVAMRMGERAVSYGELDALSAKVAAFLRSLGLERGDRVALSCPNLPYFPIVYYGILQAGLVAVPLNVLFKPREIAYHLKDCQARAYFVFEGSPELPMAQAGRAGFDEAPECQHFVVITADPAQAGPIPGMLTLGRILAGPPAANEVAATQADDTAVILYTSGTTGRPKGAELSHLNMVLNAMVSSRLFELPGQDASEHIFLAVL
ncbi:MAG TPA: AMP-binding protein, partial [Trueperaceae bacterium]